MPAPSPVAAAQSNSTNGTAHRRGHRRHCVLERGGMLYFAAAHTVFFVLLALLYERFIEIKLSASVSRP